MANFRPGNSRSVLLVIFITTPPPRAASSSRLFFLLSISLRECAVYARRRQGYFLLNQSVICTFSHRLARIRRRDGAIQYEHDPGRAFAPKMSKKDQSKYRQ